MTEKHIYEEYLARINRVLDYIDNNLAKQFTLEELAAVACFSKFHFIRIFSGIINETPFQYILRIRLQKAASLMVIDQQRKSFTEIAEEVGFTELSILSRNFKKYFGMAPFDFRQKLVVYKRSINHKNYKFNIHKKRNLSQTNSNESQKSADISSYFCNTENVGIAMNDANLTDELNEKIRLEHNLKSAVYYNSKKFINQKIKNWRDQMENSKKPNTFKSIEIKELTKITVAYIRHIGPYMQNGDLFEKLYGKLFAWAGARGFMNNPDFKTLCVYHDDPNVTEEENLRISVAFPISEDTKVDGEIGKMEVDGGKYAVARFELGVNDFSEAWNWVFARWLPESGYQCDNRACFEVYPEPQSANGNWLVDICVPVKPL
jgi:AraC family transcriptional regulator